MTIKEICEKYGLTQTALAKRFGIPLRTVQNWAGGQRGAPGYVIRMMVELLDAETHPNGAWLTLKGSPPEYETKKDCEGDDK